jgi:hypothetical protein
MEEISISETSVNYQTTQRNIPYDCHLHDLSLRSFEAELHVLRTSSLGRCMSRSNYDVATNGLIVHLPGVI